MFTSNANFEVSVAFKDSQNSAVLNDCIHVFIKSHLPLMTKNKTNNFKINIKIINDCVDFKRSAIVWCPVGVENQVSTSHKRLLFQAIKECTSVMLVVKDTDVMPLIVSISERVSQSLFLSLFLPTSLSMTFSIVYNIYNSVPRIQKDK